MGNPGKILEPKPRCESPPLLGDSHYQRVVAGGRPAATTRR